MTDIVDRLREFVATDGGNMALIAAAPEAAYLIELAAGAIERLRAERDYARARLDSAVALLVGIHALLYPPPITVADGRTMVFRPIDPDPHKVLQELSDRIRALPDEIRERGLCSH